ncbi:hypothetical protein [Salinispora mooreana]|uniref:hypothetical protein n=1 Tax=Salinispora mooreana TaxID=999545 RepID=UPI00047676F0|nr:hypothetical protein [Salinispora mooreana]
MGEAYQVLDRALALDGANSLGPLAVAYAREEVEALVASMGWSHQVSADGREVLTEVLANLRLLGCDAGVSFFAPFARAAEEVARAELDLACEADENDRKGPAIVRGVLFGVALAALRRMAREHHLALR